MNDTYWRPISVSSIEPDYFPAVAMFLKRDGNYVLYKGNETPFREDDRRRLEENATDFVYIRTGDMQEVNDYLDSRLGEMLMRNDLSGLRKGEILFQAATNSIIDLFESPETSVHLVRCSNLVRHLMQFVSAEPHVLQALHSVAGHNFYIFSHSVQVTALGLLAHEHLFDLHPDEMHDVGIGSLIHDYGLIFITDKVLNKNDALSDVEYYKVKQHTQMGYDFLKRCGKFSEVALTIVRHHHERYDGKGYPARLKGDEMPRSAQITAMCDMYSALTLDKAYRKARPHFEAVMMMAAEAESGAFDPSLFKRFRELIDTTNGT